MERWLGKVAVVTGASSGIGAAITKKLVEAGVTVVGIARRAELIEEQAKNLSSAKGKLYAVKVDVTNEQEIVNAFNWINSNVGPVQILVNNAGTLINTNLISGQYADFKTMVDTNLLAMAVCTKETLKQIKDDNLEGHVINISSILGNRVVPWLHMYSTSKHGCNAYTELLRYEITDEALNVKVTNVMPGLVTTPLLGMVSSQFFGEHPELATEDVADAVLYTIGTPQNVQITQLTIQALGETY